MAAEKDGVAAAVASAALNLSELKQKLFVDAGITAREVTNSLRWMLASR